MEERGGSHDYGIGKSRKQLGADQQASWSKCGKLCQKVREVGQGGKKMAYTVKLIH